MSRFGGIPEYAIIAYIAKIKSRVITASRTSVLLDEKFNLRPVLYMTGLTGAGSLLSFDFLILILDLVNHDWTGLLNGLSTRIRLMDELDLCVDNPGYNYS